MTLPPAVLSTATNIPPQLLNWLQNSHAAVQNNAAQKPTISRRKFSHEEDEKLKSFVDTFGENDWHNIATHMGNRNARQCRERWKHYLSPNVSTGPWTESEDQLLNEKYNEFGPQWSRISKFFPNRTDITVKNRWISLHGKSRKQAIKVDPQPAQMIIPVEAQVVSPQPEQVQNQQESGQQM